ncbi:unnamed protein product [Nesidiocoris tenuis]|uniref:EF-hand domain-containing protein n=1 Tax=Nesidiocoris tenuis TaxID=355587 RepID=A0A6H5GMN9_9HEMI|nr:unnamed protein product [Nesidiocoris tenuis]
MLLSFFDSKTVQASRQSITFASFVYLIDERVQYSKGPTYSNLKDYCLDWTGRAHWPGKNKYDEGHDGFLDLTELKRMMEKLGAPQTHLGLKAMIKEVDEDGDNKISFREFMLIFRKAKAGELEEESGLSQLAKLTEINVVEVGVGGAKHFFEAKIEELRRGSKFEDEIRQEKEERRRDEEEKAQRRIAFKEKAAVFQNSVA